MQFNQHTHRKSGDVNRALAGMGSGTRRGTGTGARAGSGRAKERRRSARNRKRVVDAMWKSGETWVGREKTHRREKVDSVAANPHNLENSREAGGEHKVPRA